MSHSLISLDTKKATEAKGISVFPFLTIACIIARLSSLPWGLEKIKKFKGLVVGSAVDIKKSLSYHSRLRSLF